MWAYNLLESARTGKHEVCLRKFIQQLNILIEGKGSFDFLHQEESTIQAGPWQYTVGMQEEVVFLELFPNQQLLLPLYQHQLVAICPGEL